MPMKSGILLPVAFSALAACLSANTAQAALIGDDIDYSITDTMNEIDDSGTVTVVDPGVEVSGTFGSFIGIGSYSLDVMAESFELFVEQDPIPLTGDITWEISDLDWVAPGPGIITGVTQTGGFPAASINFTADSITVVTFGLSPNESETFSFDIQTIHPVPEPLTILGAGTAVGFGAFFKRKLNQKQKQDRDKA